MGFKKYEIRCVGDYEHRVPYIKPEHEQILSDKVAAKEIEITALSPGVFKIGLDDAKAIRKEIDETLTQCCQMAVKLGAPKVIIFGFMGDPSNQQACAQAVSLLKEAGEIAKSFGLLLAIENEPGSFCDTGANTVKVIEAIAMRHVGINWDPGNALSCGEVPYPIGYELVKPYIQNMHIKDTIPIPPNKWENRLIGDGGVNWVGQLRAAINDDILPYLTIETHVFPLLESTLEELRRIKILLAAIKEIESTTDP